MLGFFLCWMLPIVVLSDDVLNGFIKDIISTFKLQSPTLVYHGQAPELCFTHHWVLCMNLEFEQGILMDAKGKSIFISKSFQYKEIT